MRRIIPLVVAAIALIAAVSVVALKSPTDRILPTITPRPSSVNTCPTATTRPFPPPIRTLSASDRQTPGAVETAITQYRATYPVDGYQNVKTTDRAPQETDANKTFVLVQHADCSMERFLVRLADRDVFVNSLPTTDKLLGFGGGAPSGGNSRIIPTPPARTIPVGSSTIPAVTPPGVMPSPPSPALQTAVTHLVETGVAGAKTVTPAATPTK